MPFCSTSAPTLGGYLGTYFDQRELFGGQVGKVQIDYLNSHPRAPADENQAGKGAVLKRSSQIMHCELLGGWGVQAAKEITGNEMQRE